MSSVAVSVVIPVYNEERALPNLFAALESMTVMPQEIILVSAGSTDRSTELIQQWIHDRPDVNGKIIITEAQYPGGARNTGVQSATQPWIAFLDAGIVPDRDWLSQLWNNAERNDCHAVFGKCLFLPKNFFQKLLCFVSCGLNRQLTVLPASLFHRAVFARVGFFREDLRAAEDVAWMRRVSADDGAVRVCEKARVTYDQFPSSLGAAIRKWYVYGMHAAKSGAFLRQQLVYFVSIMCIGSAFFLNGAVFAGLMGVYFLLGGIVLPTWKSRHSVSDPVFFICILCAPAMRLILDISKCAGYLHFYMQRVLKIFAPGKRVCHGNTQ